MELFHRKRPIKLLQKHSWLTTFLDVELEKSPTLYIVNEGEFLPALSADYLNHGNILISFLYRTDETTSIDASANNKVHLIGQAYTVERITLYQQFGQQPVVFSTHDSFQNPNGDYQHNWTAKMTLSILGIFFIGLGLLLTVRRGRKKKLFDFDKTSATTLGAYENQSQEPETISGNKDYR